MKQKLDPSGIAARTFAAETAKEIARKMSLDDMREVIASRNKDAMKNWVNKQPPVLPGERKLQERVNAVAEIDAMVQTMDGLLEGSIDAKLAQQCFQEDEPIA